MSVMGNISPVDPRLCCCAVERGDMVTPMDDGTDLELISSITADVMTCLRRSQFFERLDDLLCPNAGGAGELCAGDYTLAKRVLQAGAFDSADWDDIFNVLRTQGACCDCEILYNVAESSRLKAQYWKSQAQGVKAKPQLGKAQ